LEADGYVVSADGALTPAVPNLDDPDPPSEAVERLLRRFGFNEAEDHRRQALDAYRTGNNCASANAQARAFLLSLVSAIHCTLIPGQTVDEKAMRDALTRLDPPFLRPDLKEWDASGKNTFLHGVLSRFAQDGPHPGLSSREEAKFRLRLADVIALDWLERLTSRR
jgi:hypothetical protein